MEVRILMSSDSGHQPYCVSLEFEDSLVRCNCDCPDGIVGRLCKHALRAMGNNKEAGFDSSSRTRIEEFQQSIQGTQLQTLAREWVELEQTAQTTKKRADLIRREIKASHVRIGRSGTGRQSIYVVPHPPESTKDISVEDVSEDFP
ncbi:MAG: SWIM zinc finger family protein [Sedimentisphaerales bacterium]|nr:SWIM zinc finger family protein [Sedimentisphaerales bacterium]